MAGKVAPNDRSKSHMSYYVAMAIIMGLLVLLCCYACYFFINKIRELSGNDSPSTMTPSASCPKKEQPVSYPVQPVVRDSATAMAALCRQLPAPYVHQGDQVFPGARSPAPRLTGPPDDPGALPRVDPVPDKVPAPAATVPCITLEAAR